MTATAPPRPNRPFRFTREQYYRLGELGFFDGKRVELIFGEVIEMSPINWPHRLACRKVAECLDAAFGNAAWVDQGGPINLTDSEPQPDISVYAGRVEEYTDHPTTALLVVEVSATSLANDLTTKAELYATAGIADYWVLDVDARELHVFRDPQPNAALEATAYQTHTTHAPGDTVSPLAAPGATVRVGDLLP